MRSPSRFRAVALALTLLCGASPSYADEATPIAMSADAGNRRVASDATQPTDPYLRLLEATARQRVWFDGRQPSAQFDALLDELRHCDRDGLAPLDYPADALARSAARIAAMPAASDEQTLAALDREASAVALRFIRHLHLGRIDPASAHPDVRLEPRRFDAVGVLAAAVRDGRVAGLRDIAAPAHPMYRRLRDALERYRERAAQPEPPPLPPLPGRGKLSAGDPWSGLPILAERLRRSGDLPADAAVDTQTYDTVLVEAVQHFQARHGLDVDGVIGRRTAAEIDVPLRARIEQIEVALERYRWLPEIDSDTLVAINIPSFRLWALNRRDGQPPASWQTRIVVGKAKDGRTPIFIGSMRWIEFNPYWNVPPSISREELVPKLRSDPGYLARNDMEILGRDGLRTDTPTPTLIQGILAGQYRIRQNPGKLNALGRIKFVMPNNMAIYLHDTPQKQLFLRTRRDFSHGCIRVQDPQKLADLLLADSVDWPPSRIESAIESGERTIAGLRRPVPVVIFYVTATAEPDGEVRFLPDVYGYDSAVLHALKAARDRQARIVSRAG